MTKLLTVHEVAELLGLNPNTVYGWVSRGSGPPYVRLGAKAVRFTPHDVEAWIESCRV